MKKEGKFNAEAQKVALQSAYDAVMKTLSQDALRYIASITDDVSNYLTQRIEASVNNNK